MKTESEPDYVASNVTVRDRQICLDLSDGTTFSFPSSFFERLAAASDKALQEVRLRVGGRALRWENLDEDIWIADVILKRLSRPSPN